MKKFDPLCLLWLIPASLACFLAASIVLGSRTDGEYNIPSKNIDHILACYCFRGGFDTFAVTLDGDTVQFVHNGQYDAWSHKFLVDSVVVAPVSLEKKRRSHTNDWSWDKKFDIYSWR